MKAGFRFVPLLTAIAYLEVVVWITVLCTSASLAQPAAEDTAFLGSQTENLKHSLLPAFVDNPFGEVLQSAGFEDVLRSSYADQLLNKLQASVGQPGHSPHNERSFSTFVLAFTGIPAPFAGVKAIF